MLRANDKGLRALLLQTGVESGELHPSFITFLLSAVDAVWTPTAQIPSAFNKASVFVPLHSKLNPHPPPPLMGCPKGLSLRAIRHVLGWVGGGGDGVLEGVRHSLWIGRPSMNQLMVGLGFPLARQISWPLSLGARTRFLGASIQ